MIARQDRHQFGRRRRRWRTREKIETGVFSPRRRGATNRRKSLVAKGKNLVFFPTASRFAQAQPSTIFSRTQRGLGAGTIGNARVEVGGDVDKAKTERNWWVEANL